ncbi:universal stress protein [Zoogloea sp. LCSB751]|uniref:universal stress protein n=1 Tax=Zoogloea sp. LCSB751 TaxID=1965277 RepID=UPI0020B11539|nr:universal stress protein [Zoogloea sp. LCSB751]
MAYQIKSILYASDLTPRSPAVFRHAVGLATRFEAKLHAMTVSLPATAPSASSSSAPWPTRSQ